jgi:L-fuculose-phosphate aldolase
MITSRLTTGSGGNVSIFNRKENLIAVSPGSMDYFEIEADDIMVIRPDGTIVDGNNSPSSESQFHLALYHHRPDINAVIHSHSVFATAVSCLRQEIPPLHYLVGLIGEKIPVVEYATFATKALAENIVRDIGAANAALLANHGVVSVGPDIEICFIIAEHVELIAQMFIYAKSIGSPVLLDQPEMVTLQNKFKQYIFKPKDEK